jgi:tRNA threonylcarbamoyladenosine biosynthesis protein TsaE
MTTSENHRFAELIEETASVEETHELARRLGRMLAPGDFLALIGPLGAGKTALVQGLAEVLGVEGAVTSPTFVLMRLHRGEPALCHVDAYRLASAAEILDLGIEDWAEESIVALEWADTVPDALPEQRLEIRLEYTDDGRRIHFRGMGPRYAAIVEQMRKQ